MYVLYMRTYNEYIEGVGKLFAAKKEEMISGLEQTAKRKMWLFFEACRWLQFTNNFGGSFYFFCPEDGDDK